MNSVQNQVLPEGSALSARNFSVLQARRAFANVESWLLSAEAMALPEHEVEAQLEKRQREVSRLMLQAHLNQRETGDVGPCIEVCTEEGTVRYTRSNRIDQREVVSVFGTVKAARTPYVATGQSSIHPFDEELQLPERSFSYEVQRRVVEEVVRGPYQEAIQSLRKTTGNVLYKRSAEQIALAAAEDFDAFYEQRAGPPKGKTGPILVGAIDAKGIPMVKPQGAGHTARRGKGQKANKKKMATVAAVFTQQPCTRTAEQVVESLFDEKRPQHTKRPKPEHKRVWASLRKTKDQVIAEVAAEMAARDPEGRKKRAVLTDGERALQQRASRLIDGAVLILDLIHVLEKLWSAAHALYGEGTKKAKDWVRSHALMILQGRVSQVVKGMRQSATKRRLRGNKRKTIEKASKYLYRNRAYMRYDEYLKEGLPIASGAVEGACKNLIKDRMERSGMRWQIPGAEAVLRLRAIKLSGDMEQYWSFHIRRDQQRLYGGRSWRRAA